MESPAPKNLHHGRHLRRVTIAHELTAVALQRFPKRALEIGRGLLDQTRIGTDFIGDLHQIRGAHTVPRDAALNPQLFKLAAARPLGIDRNDASSRVCARRSRAQRSGSAPRVVRT